MRIVRGRFRHRTLETNPGETTRPITARVKVSLFDKLQPELQGAKVADIFAGTGTMGFEALSRGATHVVFVENNRSAFELLKQNVAALGVKDETVCWRTDAAKCSYKPQNAEGFIPFNVIFFDPPYVKTEYLTAGTLLYRAVRRLARPEISVDNALLVLRCAAETGFDMPAEWTREQILNYSSMDVHLFRKSAAAGPPPTDGEGSVEEDITDVPPESEPAG
jgi:16S rRNA (guanine966-N2)-methyltransferase